jgi:membrane-bound acyltransferase YfiQ involved in biofilm formation
VHVYTIFNSEKIFSVFVLQSHVGVLEIFYVFIGNFTSNPVVEVYFQILNVTVDNFVKMDKNGRPIVMVHMVIDLP